MTEIVIGATTDEGSRDAAALGIALARTLDAVPVVAHIRPEPWRAPGSGRVDVEWDSYLEQRSRETIDGRDRHRCRGLRGARSGHRHRPAPPERHRARRARAASRVERHRDRVRARRHGRPDPGRLHVRAAPARQPRPGRDRPDPLRRHRARSHRASRRRDRHGLPPGTADVRARPAARRRGRPGLRRTPCHLDLHDAARRRRRARGAPRPARAGRRRPRGGAGRHPAYDGDARPRRRQRRRRARRVHLAPRGPARVRVEHARVRYAGSCSAT